MEKRRTIKILTVDETAAQGGCGNGDGDGVAGAHAGAQKFAAGIDTDIFEADSLEFTGERFWESFWKTQHLYGGVYEGQALAEVLSGLPEPIFEKLREDVERMQRDHAVMADAEKDDILGMLVFLLSMERGDAMFDPIEHEGYAAAMARFATAVGEEMRRRSTG